MKPNKKILKIHPLDNLIVALSDLNKGEIFNIGNKKIKLKKSDWFSDIHEKFDIIISNPPYIKTPDIKKLDKEVKLYDPFIA